jgi:hypothetical protein
MTYEEDIEQINRDTERTLKILAIGWTAVAVIALTLVVVFLIAR